MRTTALRPIFGVRRRKGSAFGALAGVNVPLFSAEHFYIVTGRIEGMHPDVPVMRDPDGFIYYKEEVGGLVMGGFEPQAKPWAMDPIPSTFQFELLGEDWDQFEILMTNALHRTPCLETAEIKMLLNGPESFTPDGNFILGEAPELRNLFVGAGFNAFGIAAGGGAGMALAEWVVNGGPPYDMWNADIRRFGRNHRDVEWVRTRTLEASSQGCNRSATASAVGIRSATSLAIMSAMRFSSAAFIGQL